MSDFTPHPVSAGIMSWHEYNVAFDYVKKKKEVSLQTFLNSIFLKIKFVFIFLRLNSKICDCC